MKIKLNIRAKMLLFILGTTVMIFVLSVGYMSYNNRKLVLKEAEKLVLSVTKENASEIEKVLVKDYSVIKTLADVFKFNTELDQEEWKPLFSKISKTIFSQNDHFFGFSSSWEQEYFDTSASAINTRLFYHLEREGDKVVESSDVRNLESNFYVDAKTVNRGSLLESNSDARSGGFKVKGYILCPMDIHNDFYGYVVADFSPNSFHNKVQSIVPYESTEAYLITNKGAIVSHPNPEFIGDSLANFAPHFEEQFNLQSNIKEGNSSVFKGKDRDGNKIILTVVPILVGENDAPWALVLKIPVDAIMKEANNNQKTSLIVVAIGLLLLSLIIYYISTKMGDDLEKTTNVLYKIAEGDIESVQNIHSNRGDEIDLIINSVNTLKDGLDRTSVFAEQIGQGNLDASFTPLSERDKLGNALIDMKANLLAAKETEQKMKLEEDKNAWAAAGIAKFGDVIRSNNESIEKLSYDIIENLIDYIGASMGALFVSETVDDETVYGIKAAVAYDREKVIRKKIKAGEGLVGRCAFEKKSIYMTDIPNSYVNITSGLGDANPTVLFLVPLVFEDKVLGVIELSSFYVLQDYKIAFIEKLAESIASSLASVQINQRTSMLLEQSKMQGEELAAQEEEMRQNMEELQATQEEAGRREREMLSVIESIDNSVFKVEYDENGDILSVNEKYATLLNTSSDALIGKNVKNESSLLNVPVSSMNSLWPDLLTGTAQNHKIKITINGEEFMIEEHYSPIISEDESQPSKIVKVSYRVS